MTTTPNGTSNTKTTQFDPADLPSTEPEAPARTTLSGVHEDVSTDPDGAAQREDPNKNQVFPSWVFDDYLLSPVSLWGKRWDDGIEHLIPKQATIEHLIDLNFSGEETLPNAITLMLKEKPDEYKTTFQSYCNIMNALESRDHFAIMRSVQGMAQTSLAERAYAKHRYLTSADNSKPNDDGSPNEYLEKLYDDMLSAAVKGAFWVHVHKNLWDFLGWKGEPTYYVENEIKLRLVNSAKWIDENKRENRSTRPPESEYRKQAMSI